MPERKLMIASAAATTQPSHMMILSFILPPFEKFSQTQNEFD